MFVKKGTQVYYSVYAMHRREDFFGADPEVFMPERWDTLKPSWVYPVPLLNESPATKQSQEFLPFNGGPRICLGRKTPKSIYSTAYLMLTHHLQNNSP